MVAPRRKTAVLLALRYYGRELARRPLVAVPALLLPALGNIATYVAPLIVAKLAGRMPRARRSPPPPCCPTCSASPGCCCSRRRCGASACTA